jgi:hypothetical protein
MEGKDDGTTVLSTVWDAVRFGSSRLYRLGLFILMVGTLNGCAQPEYTAIKQETKVDFGSGLDLAISHHDRPDGGIVVADMFNQRERLVRVWFWHQQQTDNQKVIRGIMYYEGDKIKHREVFQVPPAEEGLTERFWVEAFDKEGKLLIQSKPIVNSNSQNGG